jgi:cellulose synthase/poly-beta-1,6-N-acetylglucosamine synthase-like glycosyltransferase
MSGLGHSITGYSNTTPSGSCSLNHSSAKSGFGARYITRADNKDAKAGNLNNGLALTAAQTNAPVILVLDADFAPAAIS